MNESFEEEVESTQVMSFERIILVDEQSSKEWLSNECVLPR